MKVKKMFSKTFAILMAICMLAQLSGVSFAVGSEPNVEIVVSGVADEHKAQLITDTINGEIIISPFGIACIFGHSTAKGTAVETTHRYYSTSPKCRRITYDVTYCTRSSCDYITYAQVSNIRVACCA